MVYDVSDPDQPEFETYVNPRDFNQSVSVGGVPNLAAGDLGPEGLEFIPARKSLTRRPLLVVSNEVSETTTVHELDTSRDDVEWGLTVDDPAYVRAFAGFVRTHRGCASSASSTARPGALTTLAESRGRRLPTGASSFR